MVRVAEFMAVPSGDSGLPLVKVDVRVMESDESWLAWAGGETCTVDIAGDMALLAPAAALSNKLCQAEPSHIAVAFGSS